MHQTFSGRYWGWVITAAALFSQNGTAPGQATPGTQERKTPSPRESVDALIQSLGKKEKSRDFFIAYTTLNAKLDANEAEQTAGTILAKIGDLAPEGEISKVIETTRKDKGDVVAARRLLDLTRTVNQVKNLKRGKVVFGQIQIEDGKLEPDMVLAQMAIHPDGWFSTEIGNTDQPLSLAAEGYRPLEVKIPKTEGPSDLGTIVMKKVSPSDLGELKGKVTFEGPDGTNELRATMSFSVPKPNSVTGGYMPRKKWPQPQTLTIAKDGSFEVKGLTPGNYYLSLQTTKHEPVAKLVTVKSGSLEELGALTLRTTDLGYHIKKEAPKAGKFPWEKDIETARKRALAEGKPMMIMMTATWCGPCKALEGNTLSDPWVQQFLKDFIVVKAYEDKAVEKQYGLNGYPTLVFTDKNGKEFHRSVGNQPAATFAGQVLKACQELEAPIDPDLKALAEKKVIKVPASPRKPVPLN